MVLLQFGLSRANFCQVSMLAKESAPLICSFSARSLCWVIVTIALSLLDFRLLFGLWLSILSTLGR